MQVLTELHTSLFPEKTRETPVGVYPHELNWRKDSPIGFISIALARKMRHESGWYSVNSGKDIAEPMERKREVVAESQKSKWAARPSGLQTIGFVNVLQLV